MSAGEFYRERDQRSLECGALTDALKRPVVVIAGNDAEHTLAGQVVLLALANLLARVHRQVAFVLSSSDVPLRVWSMLDGPTLADAIINTMRAIDPYGRFEVQTTIGDDVVKLGVGNVRERTAFTVGVIGTEVSLGSAPITIADPPRPLAVLAGGFAACLGAAAIYRAVHSQPPMPHVRMSAWNLGPSDGPSRSGPAKVVDVVDVGDVVMVGAGAVAAALAYWIRQIGVTGNWHAVDGDRVKLHNTNRGMLFLPVHAGWVNGVLTESCADFKTSVIAEVLGATPHPAWYQDWVRGTRPHYDLILPLANEHGVRHAIASLYEPILIHASTSQAGAALLHRHIPGRDDCLDCRLPGKKMQFECSTAVVEAEDGTSTDAALPFLSAMAGLMLTSALLRLQAGELASATNNLVVWNLLAKQSIHTAGLYSCDDACASLQVPAEVRRTLNQGKRWFDLGR
jgi:hypothetical protein